MNTPTPFTIKCDRYEDCNRRFDELDREVKRISDRQQTHGESIAALRAQVAMAAAFGGLVGGGVVSVVAALITK